MYGHDISLLEPIIQQVNRCLFNEFFKLSESYGAIIRTIHKGSGIWVRILVGQRTQQETMNQRF